MSVARKEARDRPLTHHFASRSSFSLLSFINLLVFAIIIILFGSVFC